MHRRYERVVGVLIVATFISTSEALAQKKYAPAYPREGVTQLQEQPSVIFWEVILEKGHPSPMYELPLDQVSIAVTEGSVKYKRPDGAIRIDQLRVGDVKFESEGTVVQEEGMSEVPGRQIVIQLKDGTPAKWPFTKGIPGSSPG